MAPTRGPAGVASDSRVYAGSAIALGLLALGHAVLSWPPGAVLALFGGGALVAFLGEVAVIRAGWLEHHVGPQVHGVPLYTLFGWTGVIYATYRVALVATDGWPAVALAAVLATAYDVLTDPRGVADGHWRYTDDLPGPRPLGVPWWNFLGWFLVTGLTAALARASL